MFALLLCSLARSAIASCNLTNDSSLLPWELDVEQCDFSRCACDDAVHRLDLRCSQRVQISAPTEQAQQHETENNEWWRFFTSKYWTGTAANNAKKDDVATSTLSCSRCENKFLQLPRCRKLVAIDGIDRSLHRLAIDLSLACQELSTASDACDPFALFKNATLALDASSQSPHVISVRLDSALPADIWLARDDDWSRKTMRDPRLSVQLVTGSANSVRYVDLGADVTEDALTKLFTEHDWLVFFIYLKDIYICKKNCLHIIIFCLFNIYLFFSDSKTK